LYGVQNNQICLESFQMWCWKKDGLVMREILYCTEAKEGRDILHTIKIRKTNWIGHNLRKKRFLKQIIEVKIVGRVDK